MLGRQTLRTTITESPRPFVVQKDPQEILQDLCMAMNRIIKTRHHEDLFKVDSDNYDSLWQVALWLSFDQRFKGDLFKGLIIQGNPGTGKTLLMQAVSEILMRNCAKSLRIINSNTIVRDYLSGNQEAINSLQKGLVCIDDLGSEPANVMIFGTTVSPVSEVIAGRYAAGRITFATTNLKASEIASTYSIRIDERVKEMMKGIVLTGETRRK